jgi:hypothetical protein
MATMVDVGLIEVNSRTLKRLEDNDEAAKRGVDCESLRSSAIPNWDALCAVSYAIEILLLRLNKRTLSKALCRY